VWRDVYAAINAAQGGCRLFGKLAISARMLRGLPPLRGQMFAVPVDTVKSWPMPMRLADREGTTTWGGGRAAAADAVASAVVDGVFDVMHRIRSLAAP
jgi:hypothetical protein